MELAFPMASAPVADIITINPILKKRNIDLTSFLCLGASGLIIVVVVAISAWAVTFTGVERISIDLLISLKVGKSYEANDGKSEEVAFNCELQW
jgi:hypothetical protein